MQEDLRLLRWQMKDLRAHLARCRLDAKYNPNVETQPRDDRGRWVEDGRQGDDSPKDPGLVSRPALLRTPPRPGVRIPVPGSIESTLSRYEQLSLGNSGDARAVLEINARNFELQDGGFRANAERLSRDKVDKVCPRYAEVQSIADQSARALNRGDYPNDAVYGTSVHTRIRDEINGRTTTPLTKPRDPNLRAEVSELKSKEVRYGRLDSIRIDVLEKASASTVCVYDIKTGTRGLSFPRMRELAETAGRLYPGTTRILVTEVRPRG